MGILVVALMLRLGVIGLVSPPFSSDSLKYDQLARNLLTGHGFTLNGKTPRVRTPPLYPLFLSGIYRLVGTNHMAVKLIQALMGTLVCWLTYYLGRSLYGSKAGLIAAGLLAIYPPAVYVSCLLLTENLYIPLLLIAVSLYLFSAHSRFRAILSGLVFGLASLTRPVALLLPAFLIGLEAVKRRGRGPWSQGALLIAFMGLTILPWTARNYAVTGQFILINKQVGGSFFMSTYAPTMGRTPIDPQERAALVRTFQAIKARSTSELDFDRAFAEAAWENIRRSPMTFLEILALNVGRFWYARNTRVYEKWIGLWNLLALILAGFGLWTSWRQPATHSLVAIIIYFWTLHLFFVPTVRMSLPIMSFVYILTALGISVVSQRPRTKMAKDR
jgi:4-amino-4-deoxy-L-arabinose transferase-like glycosyltransferase